MLQRIKKWKWVLIALSSMTVMLVISSFADVQNIGLGIVAPQIGDVIGGHEITEFDRDSRGFDKAGTARRVIKYAYIGAPVSNSAPQTAITEAEKQGLTIGQEKKRSSRSRVFETNNPNVFIADIISGVPQYYKDDFGGWWEADYATTTISEFPNKRKVPKKIAGIIKRALAVDCTSPCDFFPDPDAETNSVDGRACGLPASATWGTIVAQAGDQGRAAINPENSVYREATATTNEWSALCAGFFLFYTGPSIPDTATVSAATFNLMSAAIDGSLNSSVVMTNSNPDSNTDIAAADYTDHTTEMGTEQATARIDIDSFTNESYTAFTLSATGRGNIVLTDSPGVSKFGIRLDSDFDNTQGTWTSGDAELIQTYMAEEATTAKDPKLTVTYTTGGATTDSGEGVIFKLFFNPIKRALAKWP